MKIKRIIPEESGELFQENQVNYFMKIERIIPG